MRLAIIGSKGFVGSVIAEAAAAREDVELTRVTRANYRDALDAGPYDIVVNAAMPSARFWAEQSPDLDFIETVEKTHRIQRDFASVKIVQISSVSARCQLDKVYGRHKRAAEVLIDNGRNLIVRLGPLYHPTLSKGVIVDLLLDRPVFVSGESLYAFTPVEWAVGEILRRMDQIGIIEIGAKEPLQLRDLSAALGSNSQFQGERDDQVFDDAGNEAPPAGAVIAFAERLRSRIREWKP